MMSGHGVNPIFCNKKIKTGRLEHSLTPQLLTSDNILFLPYSLLPHPLTPTTPQSGHLCVSPLNWTEYLAYLQVWEIMWFLYF